VGCFPNQYFCSILFYKSHSDFKVNQFILKAKKRIKKQVVILGEGKVDDIVGKKANVERKRINQIRELLEYPNIDEIVVSEKITNAKDLSLLLYLEQKLKIDILFSPSVYIGLLPERINGNSSIELLNTFIGRKRDAEEFLIRSLDVAGSLAILLFSLPVTILATILIKLTSKGPALYTQKRVGKDGKVFTLYKFRTMVKDAEKSVGPVLAKQDDPRITKIGKILRRTRMDELPQLFNVLCGQMSLVGPRPERPHFVKIHKALMEIRLAVKYDYLYIQRRSLLLNLYILARTIPVVLLKKGQ